MGKLLLDSTCPDDYTPEGNGDSDDGHRDEGVVEAPRDGKRRNVIEADESDTDDE
jgi:hypothetical protein